MVSAHVGQGLLERGLGTFSGERTTLENMVNALTGSLGEERQRITVFGKSTQMPSLHAGGAKDHKK